MLFMLCFNQLNMKGHISNPVHVHFDIKLAVFKKAFFILTLLRVLRSIGDPLFACDLRFRLHPHF